MAHRPAPLVVLGYPRPLPGLVARPRAPGLSLVAARDRHLAALDRAATQAPTDPATLQARIAQAVAMWQGLATKHVQQTRQLLRKLLASRITFYQNAATGTVRFTATGTLLPVMGLLQGPEFQLVQTLVASTGFEPVFAVRRFPNNVRQIGTVDSTT